MTTAAPASTTAIANELVALCRAVREQFFHNAPEAEA